MWQELKRLHGCRGRKEGVKHLQTSSQGAFPQLVLTPSPTVLMLNPIFRKGTLLLSKVFQHCRTLSNSQEVIPNTVKYVLIPTDTISLLPSY